MPRGGSGRPARRRGRRPWPAPGARSTAKRQRSSTPLSRRSTSAAARNSSAVSGSSGCAVMRRSPGGCRGGRRAGGRDGSHGSRRGRRAAGGRSPDSASRTTRLASAAVMSAWSYGGLTSTTSIPTTGSSRQMRRTESSSCRAVSPPGSGVPVPGACPGSQTSMSTDRKTPSHSSVGDAERLGQAGVQPAVRRSRSSRRSASAARPSSPASPAAASSRAGRSAGTGRRAAPRTR